VGNYSVISYPFVFIVKQKAWNLVTFRNGKTGAISIVPADLYKLGPRHFAAATPNYSGAIAPWECPLYMANADKRCAAFDRELIQRKQ
jgi:hypothetical protein